MEPTKDKVEAAECESGLRWLSGNIRRKLTLFVVLILVMVIGLFWFFSVYMLQPAYQHSIKTDMSTQMNAITNVLDTAYEEGVPILVPAASGTELLRVSDEVVARLDAAIREGSLDLTGRCLEIADLNLRGVLRVDNLAPGCLLHLSYETGIGPGGVMVSSESDGDFITMVRREVFFQGYYESEQIEGQYVLGQRAAGGQLSVILSTNHERIPQAVQVLKRLLLPLSLLLGLLSITAVWVFSRWFTKPLNRLTDAAREMARGNYKVRVENKSGDELGILAREFNDMAYEVGLSANLQRDIMANVSHDLRTPLTLIKGYAETVRDLTGDDAEKRNEQLSVIVDETDRLSDLVGSVLELSRMSSGVEKPNIILFDLFDLCDEMGDRYKAVCNKSGYSCIFSGDGGCMVYSDPKLLERALHNLLGNALKHVGADGYIGLSIFKTKHGTARCEVLDHGEGIPPEDLPHIFDRYYRSRADNGKPGTGLGLSITKAIFDTLELQFGANNLPVQGACFWFEIPLEEE